ncbi:hypothetical protein AVEN_150466-1 [Araneus ventricosus]|uniref:Uncharacterized protein n=1 Tax=Araneus ventricosus TaxID=182803 RepID=A0A4Y2GQF7_ARAVE|nr:hypothetical protein AVEN_150466-1 [Araneus ventricosus]
MSENAWEGPIVNEIVFLAKDRGLEVDINDIDELVEGHNQELPTKELMELHCVSQQEVIEDCLSEEEVVTAKQQSSSAITEMLKAWETDSSYIENHHPNKTVAMLTTNLVNDNAVSHFYQIFEESATTNVSRQLSTKKELSMYHNSYKNSIKTRKKN